MNDQGGVSASFATAFREVDNDGHRLWPQHRPRRQATGAVDFVLLSHALGAAVIQGSGVLSLTVGYIRPTEPDKKGRCCCASHVMRNVFEEPLDPMLVAMRRDRSGHRASLFMGWLPQSQPVLS